MGLFDAFKKKKEEPVPQNNPNSVFTLRFTIPFFPVFDKTNPKLRAFPVKLSCGGSVQYRIADPTLCFDNVPLGSMSAGQLEEHVKDSLHASVKSLINSIDYMPLLQYETELENINEYAKNRLVAQFADEYGINLRTFNLSRITYDTEDPNYQRLYEHSANVANTLHEHELSDMEEDRADALYEREHRRRVRNLADDEDLIERENNLRLRRQSGDHALRRNEHQLGKEMDSDEIELERKRRELEEDMHARRTATDTGAKMSQSLSQRPMGGGMRPSRDTGMSGAKPKDGGLDLGSL